TETPRIGGRTQPGRTAVDENLPGIGMMRAAEDAHQRGLARSVLPEQYVNRPGFNRQRDAIESTDARECLGDPAHLEERRHDAGNYSEAFDILPQPMDVQQ